MNVCVKIYENKNKISLTVNVWYSFNLTSLVAAEDGKIEGTKSQMCPTFQIFLKLFFGRKTLTWAT